MYTLWHNAVKKQKLTNGEFTEHHKTKQEFKNKWTSNKWTFKL